MGRRQTRKAVPFGYSRTDRDKWYETYRVIDYVKRGGNTGKIFEDLGVHRQRILSYFRDALECGMLKLGRLPLILAEDIKEGLGPVGRDVEIEVVPAESNTPEFYNWTAEQAVKAIQQVLQQQGSCAVAVGGGRSTFNTVRAISENVCSRLPRDREIRVYPATSGIDPKKPELGALIIGALLWAKLDPQAASPYEPIVGGNRDPRGDGSDRESGHRDTKDTTDVLLSGIGDRHSPCAVQAGLDPTTIAGEFLFQPFDYDGHLIKPKESRVKYRRGPDEGSPREDAEPQGRFDYLFSLEELRLTQGNRERPLVIGIGTDFFESGSQHGKPQPRQRLLEEKVKTRRDKVEAVLGALRGRFIRRLIVSMDLAERLVEAAFEARHARHSSG